MKRILLSLLLAITIWSSPSHAVVSSTINQNKYACDSTTVSWPYTFPIILSTDIQVWTIDSSGNPTQQTSNFSVNTVTKSVTYPVSGTACTIGNSLLLLRVQSLTQQVAASNQGPAPSPVVMTMSDKLTMIAQQLQGEINLAFLQPLGSTGSVTFPSSNPGYLIGWNNSGVLSNINNPSAVAQWALSVANISYNTGNVSTSNNFTAGSLNWTNIQLIKSREINWADINGVIPSASVNWNDMNRLAKMNYGGINWPSTNIFPTSATGNVGIGTSNPGQTLDVNGTVRATTFLGSGATKFKVVSFTHDISASGTQSITGVGFTPKAVIFLSTTNVASVAVLSIGADDGSTQGTAGLYPHTSSTTLYQSQSTNSSITLETDDVTLAKATITTFGADGFTITWVKTGSPTGTATVVALCLG